MSARDLYDPERVRRLAEISTKFHQHAAVGDGIVFGIDGDKAMPAKYRGAGGRPGGTIVKIKNAGSENSTLRVQMNGTGKMVDVHPFQLDGGRLWEYDEETWPRVLARANPDAAASASSPAFRGAGGGDELGSVRAQLADLQDRYHRETSENRAFQHALVESIAQITGEIQSSNPNAKFSKVFQEEYKSSARAQGGAVFDSDFEDDDDL